MYNKYMDCIKLSCTCNTAKNVMRRTDINNTIHYVYFIIKTSKFLCFNVRLGYPVSLC